jgi:putative glutamine amidotransferase
VNTSVHANTKPLIGITSYVERATWGPWDAPAALVPLSYVGAVEDAGGRPVILPPIDEGVDEILDALHGIMFSGGADIDPKLYGADRHPETSGVRPDRDRSETELMKGALDRGIPMLAICRGMQLLNVVRGGDLEQHLPEVTGDDAHKQAPGVFTRHEVDVHPDSRLAAVLGNRSSVASHHHQAPARLGRGLQAAARASDGTIEAVEDPAARMVIGVLWHPEESEDRALFEALVHEAAVYSKERA